MLKRVWAFLIVLTLAFSCVCVVPAASDAPDEGTEELIRLLRALTSDESIAIAAMLGEEMYGLDRTETEENLGTVKKVVESEEFAELCSHQEFCDLIAYFIKNTGSFVDRDPELAEKILVAAGMAEEQAGAAVSLLRSGILSADLLNEKVQEVTGMNLFEYGQNVASTEEFKIFVDTLEKLKTLTEDAAESGAESMAEAADSLRSDVEPGV